MIARLKDKLHYSTADETGTLALIDGTDKGVTEDTALELATYVCGYGARKAAVLTLAIKFDMHMIGKTGFLGFPTRRDERGGICYKTTLASFLAAGMYEPSDEHKAWMKEIEKIA